MKKVVNDGAHPVGLGAAPDKLGDNSEGLSNFDWLAQVLRGSVPILERLMSSEPPPPLLKRFNERLSG